MILHPGQPVENIPAPSGGSVESSHVTEVSLVGAAMEVQSVTALGAEIGIHTVTSPAFAGAAQADYFVFADQNGDKYAVWLDKDAADVQPSGAAFTAADNKIEVDIVTGDTAIQVATKVETAINADAAFIASALTIGRVNAVITVTQGVAGPVAAIERHNENDSGTGSFVIATTNDGSAISQGDYFTFVLPNGDVVAAWLDIDEDGTEPTGAAYVASDVQIMLPVDATMTQDEVASEIKDTLELDADFIASGIVASLLDNVVTLTYASAGNIAAPARHSENDGGNGSFVVATVSGGTSPSLNSKYFLISSSGVNYYVWYNVGSQGVDPAVVGRTGVPVALNGAETDAQIATATAAAIDALALLNSHAEGAVVVINADAAADVLNASVGNAGLNVEIRSQGAESNVQAGSASQSPNAASANPAIINAGT